MEQSTNNNFSDIISAFSTINTSLAFDVYLPIAKKTVRFKQMTTGQEKRIAKQLLVGENSTIYSIMPDILQENCLDHGFSVADASIIDFFCIIMQTRIYSIGNQITLQTFKTNTIDRSIAKEIKNISSDAPLAEITNEKEQNDKKTNKNDVINIKLNLVDIYNSIKTAAEKYSEVTISIEDCPYQLVCGVPTVKTIQNSIDDDDDNLVTRLIKFILEIDLVNPSTKEAKQIILSDFSTENAKKLIESIPNRLLVKASEQIVELFKLLTTLQLYKFKVGNTEYVQTLNFTSLDFFTSF